MSVLGVFRFIIKTELKTLLGYYQSFHTILNYIFQTFQDLIVDKLSLSTGCSFYIPSPYRCFQELLNY